MEANGKSAGRAAPKCSTKILSPLKALAMEGDEKSNNVLYVYIL
jgi:hypothetical protein